MIAFLTLCYVAVLAILVKLGVIRLNLWWKLSPLAWLLVLLIVLFIPMQWGAPSGPVNQFNYVVEVVPNVSGEVVEVPAEPLTPIKQGEELFKIDPRPYQYALDQLKADLTSAVADRDYAKIQLERNKKLEAESAAAQQRVDEWQARYDSSEATIKSLDAQIDNAQYNLDETSVRAPGDGYVVGLSLRPGQRVTSMPLRSWMAYVESDHSRLVTSIPQYLLRHVKPGQSADVVLKLYPGKTFTAKVDSIVPINAAGQLQPTGLVPTIPTESQPDQAYGVVLAIDDPDLNLPYVPGGASGTAAIYTESAKATHLIRRVMMRMQAWMNYIIP